VLAVRAHQIEVRVIRLSCRPVEWQVGEFGDIVVLAPARGLSAVPGVDVRPPARRIRRRAPGSADRDDANTDTIRAGLEIADQFGIDA